MTDDPLACEFERYLSAQRRDPTRQAIANRPRPEPVALNADGLTAALCKALGIDTTNTEENDS